MFRLRIRLMGHPRPQFRVKADLPVGFPYRFNSSLFLVLSRVPLRLNLIYLSFFFFFVQYISYTWAENLSALCVLCTFREASCCYGCNQKVGSVPVDFLRPKFGVAHTKHDVISILMNKYTYINMYIIKKIISCIFILCWDITALLKLKWKFAGYV